MFLVRNVERPTDPIHLTDVTTAINTYNISSMNRTSEIVIQQQQKASPEFKQSVFRLVNASVYLKKFTFTNAGLNDRDIKTFIESYVTGIHRKEYLEHLDLSGNYIGELGFALIGVLISHRGLKSLTIRNNQLPIGHNRITEALSGPYRKLVRLDLTNCIISPDVNRNLLNVKNLCVNI